MATPTEEQIDQQILKRAGDDEKREYFLGAMLDTFAVCVAGTTKGGRVLNQDNEDRLLAIFNAAYEVLLDHYGTAPNTGAAPVPAKSTKGLDYGIPYPGSR